jgi:hypothetical protein
MEQRSDLISLIKNLAPVEVFDYYDGPRFYSCRDTAGQLYLVYWVDESERGSSWLYLKVSHERYGAMRRGDLALSEVLSNPEEGIAFLVHTESSGFIVSQLTTDEIEPDWIPEASDRLNLPQASLPSNLTTPTKLAQHVHRHVFDIAFEKQSNNYEMGAGKLGRLLEAFQNTLYALSCNPKLDVRRVPEEIKQRSEILVTGLFASSFGVRLQTKGSDLFGTDDISRALMTLTKLLDGLRAHAYLNEQLHQLNILARSRFKHLLRVMLESQVAVKADWGAPSGEMLQAHASFSDIALALQKLEAFEEATQQTVERSARLVGVDVQSDFFALVFEDGEVIKGKLSKGLSTKHFEVPSRVMATLQESAVVDPLTDREKWSYVLLGVNTLSDKSL